MCSALQVQERAVPSLIAAWPAAAAAVVRTYQVPPAGPFLQQLRRTAGATALPGFSSRPRIGRAGPCGRTSALLCSAKISAQPVWLLQGLAGLNWNLIFYARILMWTIALSPLIVFRKKTVSKKFVRGFEGRRAGSEPALRKRSRPAGCLQHLPPLLYSASLRSTPKLDCYCARHKKVSVLQYSVLRCFRSLQCPGR